MAPGYTLVWLVSVIYIGLIQLTIQKESMEPTTNQAMCTPSQNSTDNTTDCSLVLPSNCAAPRTKKTLYLLAMAPYPRLNSEGPQPSWAGGPEVIPGALLAVSHINCNSAILQNYTLDLVIKDGGCNQTSTASSNFLESIFYESQEKAQNIVGIIGGGCSESSLLIGYLAAQDRISLLQIAPSATSPLFVTEAEKYQNTFRPTVSAQGYIKGFLNIIHANKYTEVAVLYEANREYMTTVATELSNALSNNVKVESFGLVRPYLEIPLNELQNKNRLIFVFAATKLSQEILCIAYQKRMRSPDYQFIFINRRPRNFLTEVIVTDEFTKRLSYTCNCSEMNAALSAATLFEFRVTRQDKDTPTFSGYSYNEAQCPYRNTVQEHKRLLNLSTVGTVSTEFQNTYYDATWALALSLHNANVMGVNLANYTYGQPSVTKTIREQLFNVSFEGLSGKVQFSNETLDGSEVTIIDIFQRPNNSSEFRRVGCYVPDERQKAVYAIHFLKKSVFDRTLAHPPSALGYVFIVIAVVVGLGIAILHCLNSAWGDLKTVKAASPQLNHLIFSGCYLILLDVVLYSVETTIIVEMDSPYKVAYGVLCNAQVWVHSLSFSLVFGTVCVKTWRIFRIFSHFKAATVKYVGDNVLIGFVLCLVSVDTVYLTAWNAINPLVINVLDGQPQEYRAICSCNNLTYWICFLVAYKVVLLVFVLYLSISTRHIRRLEFKQTKSINTLIYILVIVTLLGVVPYAITIASRTTALFPIIAAYVTLSISYILTAIMCAVFVFLPPLYPVLTEKWKSVRAF